MKLILSAKNRYLFPAILAIIGLLLCAIFFKAITIPVFQDGYTYIALARSLLNTGSYTLYHQPYFWREPFYPIFITFFDLLFRNTLFSAKIVSALFGVLTIPLVYLLWEKLENWRVALLAGFLFTITPIAVIFRVLPMTETLFTFFIIVSLILFYLNEKNTHLLPFVGLSAAFSALTRPEGYLLIIAIGIGVVVKYELYRFKRLKEFLLNKFAICAIFAVTIPIALWWMRNILVIGRPWPTREYLSFIGAGFNWFSSLTDVTSIPFLVLALVGMILSAKKWRIYSPIFAYIVLIAISRTFVLPTYSTRYAISVMPILLGFTGKGLIELFFLLSKKKLKMIVCVVFAVLIILFSVVHFSTVANTELGSIDKFKRYYDFGEWFNQHAPPNAKLLAGDAAIYDYFIDSPTYDISEFSILGLKGNTANLKPYIIRAAFEENIQYIVAFDNFRGATQTVNANIQGFSQFEEPLFSDFISINGTNIMNLNITAGIYTYSDGTVIRSVPIFYEREQELSILYFLSDENIDATIEYAQTQFAQSIEPVLSTHNKQLNQ